MKRGEVKSPVSLKILELLTSGVSRLTAMQKTMPEVNHSTVVTSVRSLTVQGYIIRVGHGLYGITDAGCAILKRPPVGVPAPARRRAKSLAIRDVSLRKLYAAGEHIPGREDLPANREDCRGGPRPCPLVRCRYNLYLEVKERTGTITPNFPGTEVWDMKHSCSLDVADAGEQTLERVAEVMGFTREAVRLIEAKALVKVKRASSQF